MRAGVAYRLPPSATRLSRSAGSALLRRAWMLASDAMDRPTEIQRSAGTQCGTDFFPPGVAAADGGKGRRLRVAGHGCPARGARMPSLGRPRQPFTHPHPAGAAKAGASRRRRPFPPSAAAEPSLREDALIPLAPAGRDAAGDSVPRERRRTKAWMREGARSQACGRRLRSTPPSGGGDESVQAGRRASGRASGR